MVEPLLFPSAVLLEFLPILRHLPSWLPGMQVKRLAGQARAKMDAMVRKLCEEAIANAVRSLHVLFLI